MLLDGLQLVRLGGSLFEGVVLSPRGISGEEAGQVGAWRGFVRVSCAGRAPGLAGALSARGVSHRRHLRDAAIVLVGVCLTQACAETTRVTTHPGSTMGPSHQGPPTPAPPEARRQDLTPEVDSAAPRFLIHLLAKRELGNLDSVQS